MVKYIVALMFLAVAANAYTLNAAQNSATNSYSPYAQIHHSHLQNSYDYTGGRYGGGYYPYGGYGGFGGFGGFNPFAGININQPINQADNIMSPGALITNANSQNNYRF